jgi:hypothetical protein
MSKQKVLLLIPLLILLSLLIYCWTNFLLKNFIPTWKHYLGILFFIPLAVFFFKNSSNAIVGLGIYLLLATFNLLAITPAITTSWVNFGSSGFTTPPVQLLSLGLFILYFIMNLDSLINIQLDYKELKASKVKNRENNSGLD